jgi:hypothetical protein
MTSMRKIGNGTGGVGPHFSPRAMEPPVQPAVLTAVEGQLADDASTVAAATAWLPRGAVPLPVYEAVAPGQGKARLRAMMQTMRPGVFAAPKVRQTRLLDERPRHTVPLPPPVAEPPKKKGGGIFGKIGGAFKKIGSGIAKVGKAAWKAMPVVSTVMSFIPGLNVAGWAMKAISWVGRASSTISSLGSGNVMGALTSAVPGGSKLGRALGRFKATGVGKLATRASGMFAAIRQRDVAGVVSTAEKQ